MRDPDAYILYVHMQTVIQSATNNQIAKTYPELRLAVDEERDKQNKVPTHRTFTAACTPTRSRRP